MQDAVKPCVTLSLWKKGERLAEVLATLVAIGALALKQRASDRV